MKGKPLIAVVLLNYNSEEDLFIINRKSGKKYKFSLEEIEEIE